jgi:hypothetical protein
MMYTVGKVHLASVEQLRYRQNLVTLVSWLKG